MSTWNTDPDPWGADGEDAGADLAGLSALPEEPEEELEIHDEDLGSGIPDATLSVRVWLREDQTLAKVRVSNKWRERGRGTSLSAMFAQAFMFAYARLGAEPTLPEPQASQASPQLTWDEIEKLANRALSLREESARLDAQAGEPTRWEGTEPRGTDPGSHCVVTLDIHGHVRSVDFSEGWLKDSRVSEVCDAVQAAYEDAYRSHVPPTYVEGERARLAAKAAAISDDVDAMLRTSSI